MLTCQERQADIFWGTSGIRKVARSAAHEWRIGSQSSTAWIGKLGVVRSCAEDACVGASEKESHWVHPSQGL